MVIRGIFTQTDVTWETLQKAFLYQLLSDSLTGVVEIPVLSKSEFLELTRCLTSGNTVCLVSDTLVQNVEQVSYYGL